MTSISARVVRHLIIYLLALAGEAPSHLLVNAAWQVRSLPQTIDRETGNVETIKLTHGKQFDLRVHRNYKINIAAEGLKRARFMALSPDNRLFVTDMHNLTDNRRGIVYVVRQVQSTNQTF